MEPQAAYQKPGLGKRIIYLFLLLFPALLCLLFAVGFYGVFTAYGYMTFGQLYDDRNEIGYMAAGAIIDYYDASIEQAASLDISGGIKAISEFRKKTPEITAMFSLIGDDVKTIFNTMDKSGLKEVLDGVDRAAIDTVKSRDIYRGHIKRLGYNTTRLQRELAGNNILLTYIEMPDETRLVVTSMAVMQEHAEAVMAGMADSDTRVYEAMFGRYPVTFAEIELSDANGVVFYKVDRSRGEGWDQVLEWQPLGWNLKVKYYPDDWSLTRLDYTDFKPTKLYIAALFTCLLIVLLGHFSPRLHGFSLKKTKED